MPLSASPERSETRLALSSHPCGTAIAAHWIGSLVALGARVSRYAARLVGRQLVVAISVPRRDFAATLVGCGWVMTHPAPNLDTPIDVMRQLRPQTPVRVVTDQFVIVDHFLLLDEVASPSRVQLGGRYWQVDRIKAFAVLPSLDMPVKETRPELGSIGRLAHLEKTWDARLACPAADLAIVGTLGWLRDDLSAFLTRDGEERQTPCSISALLLPRGRKVATWSTRLYASAQFSDQLPLPDQVRAVVLDGFGAIKYLGELETPVLIGILDRSVADQSAAELIVQLRNTRGKPLSVSTDLGWRPPAGVEALAFTVPL